VDQFALREQREARQRVGVLAAGKGTNRPVRRLVGAQAAAVAARPGQLLGEGRHELAVAPEQRSIRPEHEVGVVDRAEAQRAAFIDPNYDIGPSGARGMRQQVGLRARNEDRRLV
jgi:hypothetical protein